MTDLTPADRDRIARLAIRFTETPMVYDEDGDLSGECESAYRTLCDAVDRLPRAVVAKACQGTI